MEKSLRVAIVDDLTEDSQRLADYLEQFQREHNMEIKMDVYNASFEFLEKYHGNYDVIFLDIEMPGSDGLEVAREIRTKDEAVGIIFVTPVGYYNFAVKLEKAIQFFRKRQTKEILINGKDGIHRIAAAYVYYIEKSRDDLLFHTVQGDFQMRGSIFRCVRRRYWYSCFCPGDGADC